MNDLLNPLFAIPIGIVLAEMLAAVSFRRTRSRWWLFCVIGSYLAFVVVAIALGFIGHDEFGFSRIPLLVLTNPWVILLGKVFGPLSPHFIFTQTRYGMILGTLLNCAIFYILGKVGYPKHSAKVSGQHAT